MRFFLVPFSQIETSGHTTLTPCDILTVLLGVDLGKGWCLNQEAARDTRCFRWLPIKGSTAERGFTIKEPGVSKQSGEFAEIFLGSLAVFT